MDPVWGLTEAAHSPPSSAALPQLLQWSCSGGQDAASDAARAAARAALGLPDSSSAWSASAEQAEISALFPVLRRCAAQDAGAAPPSARDGASARRGGGPQIALSRRLGRGGFARVFLGRWHGVVAAIKVVPSRAAASAAMEMAVLSMVQHPNIVQLYAVETDVPDPAARGAGAAARAPCNILVLEYCDRGSLRDTAKGLGLGEPPHAPGTAGGGRAPPPPPPPPLAAACAGRGGAAGFWVPALLDVAHALSHLHDTGLIHGDIKLDNVLVRNDPLRRHGFTCKLADLGLARLLGHAGQIISDGGCAGTLTHLAPELLAAGAPVTTAADSYAFGVMMWDLYMGGTVPAYPGLSKEELKRGVATGARPEFPAGTPPAYEALARDCWATDPAARPSMAEAIRRLEALLPAAAA